MQVPGLIKIVALLLIVVCMVAGCGGGMVPSLSGQQPPTPLLGRYSYIPFPSHVPRGKVVFSDRQFPDAVNPFFSGSAVDFEVSTAL